MNTDEKILKALENLQAGQAHLTTAVETLKAGQDDIREKLETKADKADILDLGAKLDKYQKRNEQRFENLEDSTGTHNPHKN